MKKTMIILQGLLLVGGIIYAESGTSITFKNIHPINGTTIGTKIGILNPYIGFDMFHFDLKDDNFREEWDTYWDWEQETEITFRSFEKKSELELSSNLFIPHAGLKIFFNDDIVKTYLLGDFMVIVPSVTGTDNGRETHYNPDGNIDWQDQWDDEFDLQDEVDIHIFGIMFGFGVEYSLGESMTIGGEYGFRSIMFDIKTDGETDDEYWKEKWKNEVNASLLGTYTAFSLNFYF